MTHDVSPAESYWIRPDIFIKTGEGKLYLRYRDKHYVLKMPSDRTAVVLRFLDQFDGFRSLNSILAEFPAGQHAILHKMLAFLLDKGAAFVGETQLPAGDFSAVADTLAYLAEYSASPVNRYRAFASQRILLVGAGYALISAIKTFSRIGIQRLFVLHRPELGHHRFDEADLRRAFDDIRSWPGAEMIMLEPSELTVQHFDWVLHCSELITAVPAACTAALEVVQAIGQLYGQVVGHTLVINTSPALPAIWAASRSARDTGSPIRSQTCGACFALAAFDAISGVRPWLEGHYGYYELDGVQPLRFAPHHEMKPWPELRLAVSTTTSGKSVLDVLDAWNERSPGPLFPIEKPEELTAASSYVKVYRVRYTVVHNGNECRESVIAAGYDRRECLTQTLTTMATAGGIWFDGTDAAERERLAACASVFERARVVASAISASALRIAQRCGAAVRELSAREEYIRFCIGSRFAMDACTVDVDTSDAEFPRCRIAFAGSAAVFMPFREALSTAESETLLFGLYAELYRQLLDDAGCRPQTVLVAPSLVEYWTTKAFNSAVGPVTVRYEGSSAVVAVAPLLAEAHA